jgi:acetyltransferase-like isoleucine patch superfamily enzyme
MLNIHPTADVQTASIGDGTRIWQNCVVLPGAIIGRDCNLCAGVFVENDVIIGERVTLKSGVQLWDGVVVEDDVFIGPNATFTNDLFPRSRHKLEAVLRTTLRRGASVGANATIMPGITIGEHSMVGAGAVVTRDVPPYAVVIGNPATITGYVDVQNNRKLVAHKTNVSSKSSYSKNEFSGCTLHQLPRIEDLRGNLSVIEFEEDIPFNVKRIFWVYGVPGKEVRGAHAHKKCHQFLICVAGSMNLVLDNGATRSDVILDRPDLGIHIPPMHWGVQYMFSSDAILLVLASHHYDVSDYIRDYDEFLSMFRANDSL